MLVITLSILTLALSGYHYILFPKNWINETCNEIQFSGKSDQEIFELLEDRKFNPNDSTDVYNLKPIKDALENCSFFQCSNKIVPLKKGAYKKIQNIFGVFINRKSLCSAVSRNGSSDFKVIKLD